MARPGPARPALAPWSAHRTGFGAGPVLAIAGAVAIFVSIFIDWSTSDFFPGGAFTANDIPWQFLWDTTPASFDDPSLLYPLIVAVALCLAGAFVPSMRWVAIIGGAIGILIPLLFVRAVRNVLADDFYAGAFEGGTIDFVSIGTWVCLAGGVLALVGGALATADRARRMRAII